MQEGFQWSMGLKAPEEPPAFYLPPSVPLHNPVDSGGDSESDTALLPKRTVVRIVGNARTKQSLLGQTAIVKRAVGLGGWHWLTVLPTGEEVKLQRNALEDMSEEEEEEQRRQQQQQQMAAARGYPYEPAEPHAEGKASISIGRRRPPGYRPRPPRRPSSVPPQPRYEDYGGRTRLHSSRGAGQPRINLSKLQTAALKRYGAVYHLPAAEEQQATRDQLLDAVSEHFAAQQVDESEVIACFLSAVKRHRMGLPR
ncbi:hypothetical protein CHLNCDRAFT_137141 [Chlorella variabilis]|uniref:Uncharacterized protein n=1 Tax=Chlorella variabilis TaxID=554065 RepID=E1ZLB7_CHLVA|nr:hypothetical protein CHLNCDRAFT_137141 [Chlorella variabilis]EFN53240.1 hypothetical protein CHLNCDRAFT_137141 [Chlorella variabilis]|eukprot:XP_005845342.1 hypothetical protein CHLNCDRAFT_137141 [Chlorella variabilis]